MLCRIEGQEYLQNKAMHNEYLKINPFAARNKFINLYSTAEHAFISFSVNNELTSFIKIKIRRLWN